MPVYQFEGKHYSLPDGLSDEQAVAKIKSSLGQDSGVSDFLHKAVGQTGEFMGEVGKTLAGVFTPNVLPPSGTAETGTHLATGMGSMVGGLPPAAMGALNDVSQGQPANFEQKYTDAMDRLTYKPTTEIGQHGAQAAGEFINRNLVPIAPMLGLGMGSHVERAPKPEKAPKKVVDEVGAINDILNPTTITPGADRPPSDLPPSMPVTSEGQGVLSPQDAMFKQMAEQKQAEAQANLPEHGYEPQGGDPFAQMKQQLNTPQRFPEQNPVMDALSQELQGGRKPPMQTQGELPFNEHPELDLQQQPMDLPPRPERSPMDGTQGELLGHPDGLDLQADAQIGPQGVADPVRGPQGEMLGNPDLFELSPSGKLPQLPRDSIYTQSKRAAIDEKVAADERVVQAQTRLDKAAELYIKAADAFQAGRLEAATLKRIERDMNNFQDALDFLKKSVEGEMFIEARKASDITASGRQGRQRGAWDLPAIKQSLEKLLKGEIGGRDYLKMWDGAFDPRQWNKVLADLNNPHSSRTVAFMSPREFHRLAEPRGAEGMQGADRLHQNIRGALKQERGLLDAPTLWVKKAADGSLQVVGHEGRNRMDVFRDEGVSKVPVVFDSKDVKWNEAIPAKIRPEWVGDSKVLDMDMPKVLHEGETGPHRDTFRKPGGPGGRQGGWILLESSKKKALTNLADKIGIEEKLKEFAPTQWTPKDAIEQIKKSQDLDQNAVQNMMNYLTKGGQYLALKTHNPMIRFIVDKFLDADRSARAAVRDWIYQKDTGLGDLMRGVNKREAAQVWRVLDVADLHQKSVDLAALAERGFSKAQLDLIKGHRAAMDYAMSMINKAREASGLSPVDSRTAYAAMQATGDFRRLVFDEKGGNIVGIISSNFRGKLNERMAQMQKSGYHVGEERYFGGMPRERGSANQAFMQAIDMLADKDNRVAEFVEVLNQIRTTEINNFLNMKRHTMEKKGVFGMEGRKQWESAEQNAQDGFKTQLNYLEASIKWGHLAEAFKDAREVLNSDQTQHMPKAREWSEKYVYNALGFNPSKIGQNIEQAIASAFDSMGVGFNVGRQAMATTRYITNSMLLALNPRFWATNVIQPLQSMPGMKADLIARGLDAGFDFGTGYLYLTQGYSTASKIKSGMKLDPIEKAAADYAVRKHVYGSDMVEHSNRPSKDFGYYAEKVSNSVAGNIESATRQGVYYAFVHMLKENGMVEKNGLFEAAHNLTDVTMNNYSAVERPQMYNSMGPVGDLAVNLQSYKHNELSRLSMFVRDSIEHKSLRPVVADSLSRLAFGGILGFIAYDDVDAIFRFVSKKLGKPMSLGNLVYEISEGTNKMAYEKTGGKVDAPYLVSNGIPSMLGIDMSRSLGLTDVFPNSIWEALFPGGSKMWQAMSSTWDLAINPTEMNAKRAAYDAAPVALQGPMSNAWFTHEGADGTSTVARARDLKAVAYRNSTDTLAKNLSFTGLNESVQKQKTYNVERISRDYADLRQKPLDNMRDSIYATGDIRPADVAAYVNYRGSIETLEGDINRYAQEQNLTGKELAQLRAQASSSVGALSKARDYLDAFTK